MWVARRKEALMYKVLDELKKEIQALEDKSKLGFGIILEDEED